jgi:hypothetical protein
MYNAKFATNVKHLFTIVRFLPGFSGAQIAWGVTSAILWILSLRFGVKMAIIIAEGPGLGL